MCCARYLYPQQQCIIRVKTAFSALMFALCHVNISIQFLCREEGNIIMIKLIVLNVYRVKLITNFIVREYGYSHTRWVDVENDKTISFSPNTLNSVLSQCCHIETTAAPREYRI